MMRTRAPRARSDLQLGQAGRPGRRRAATRERPGTRRRAEGRQQREHLGAAARRGGVEVGQAPHAAVDVLAARRCRTGANSHGTAHEAMTASATLARRRARGAEDDAACPCAGRRWRSAAGRRSARRARRGTCAAPKALRAGAAPTRSSAARTAAPPGAGGRSASGTSGRGHRGGEAGRSAESRCPPPRRIAGRARPRRASDGATGRCRPCTAVRALVGPVAGGERRGDERAGRRADEVLAVRAGRAPRRPRGRRARPAATRCRGCRRRRARARRGARARAGHAASVVLRRSGRSDRTMPRVDSRTDVRDNVRRLSGASPIRIRGPSGRASAPCARRLDLSLRDLAERCGVSAPDAQPGRARGDQPDAAGRRADRLRARPAPLPAAAPRRGRRGLHRPRATSAAASGATATRYEVLTPRRCPASAPRSPSTRSRPARAPATRRCTSPARRETVLVSRGAVDVLLRRRPPRPARGRQRHLRRRPAPPLREPRKGGGGPARRPVGRTATLMTPMRPPRCSTRSGPPTRWRPGLIYIDLHLVHEVTSPQAFDGLRLAGRPVRRPDRTLATADHNVPTDGTPVGRPHPRRALAHAGRDARAQLRGVRRPRLLRSARSARASSTSSGRSSGVTQPGHDDRLRRLATPPPTARSARWPSASARARSSTCSPPRRWRSPSRSRCASPTRASSGPGVTAKDLILATIGQMGTGGAAGHAVEFAGPAIEALSMEGRMTICNMTIEGGGRAGMIAPDDTTFEWLARPPAAPADLDAAVEQWRAAAHRRGRDVRQRDRDRRVARQPAS